MNDPKFSLTNKALSNLPFGKFAGFAKAHDMAGVEHDAVIWAFWDGRDNNKFRKAYFKVEDGSYIGEKDL